MKRTLPVLVLLALFVAAGVAPAQDAAEDSGALFNKATVNLIVDDMETSLNFWRAFGFAPTMTVPEQPPYGWVALKRDGVEVFLQTRASVLAEDPTTELPAETGGTFALYVEVADLDAVREMVPDEALVMREVYSTEYGAREFVLRSPAFYVVVFAEFSGQ